MMNTDNNKFSDFPTSSLSDIRTPKSQGYFFPAEWEKHEATWLSWPHKEDSWPGKLEKIYPYYCEFIKILSQDEFVRINVRDEEMRKQAMDYILQSGANLENIEFYFNPTNDAWCRDHGPAFLIQKNKNVEPQKVIVDWDYNAWGDKYPPYELDDVVPTKIGEEFDIPVFHPGIVMEGGSVEFNGKGTLLTSKSCLLNPNRNPHLNQEQIEEFLKNFYGVEQILWIDDGIIGDDTDGHVDDTVRFVNENTVLTVIEANPDDDNYEILQINLRQLKEMKLLDGSPLNIIELPMPNPVYWEDQRLPASYANFYISNHHVIVPTYRCDKDSVALEIIQKCFPERKVVGIDSTEIIWGLGSFHCLSQQEPMI